MDMSGLRKNAVITIYTNDSKCITGRYLGVKGGKIRIVLQRRIIPDSKLLGEGVVDRTLIRCSNDFGNPIDIPIENAKTWSYANYNHITFVGEPKKKDYFWEYFHYYDAKYMLGGNKVSQYSSKGFCKGNHNDDIEEDAESIPNIDETSIPNM